MNHAAPWFWPLFPVLLLGFWLGISAVSGVLSGWFALQRRYPKGDEKPLLVLHLRTAKMKDGVNYDRRITIAACPSGLQVSINRLVGPFQRPFTVPWHEITATDRKVFLGMVTRLQFGRPAIGQLTMSRKDWEAVRGGN